MTRSPFISRRCHPLAAFALLQATSPATWLSDRTPRHVIGGGQR